MNGAAISGATGSSYNIASVKTTDAGNYSVNVINAYGTTPSSSATLTVTLPPTIAIQPTNQTVTLGRPVSFSVVASGTSPLTYQWYLNGSSLGKKSGAQTAIYSLTSAASGNAGNYTVVVKNSVGSVTSAVATLTVNVPASITTQPSSQAVTMGQTASFSVVASGTAPFSYQWNVKGTNVINGPSIFGSTNATLTLSNVQPAQAGNVFVVITNFAGGSTSSVVTLTVNVPATITNQPQSQAVLAGQSAKFSVGATGTANLQYQWYFNGTKLGSGSGNSTLSLSSVGTNNAGTYSVVVNNNYGSATSAVATLTVYVPPAITAQPTNLALVLGQNAAFAVVALGTPALAYQWNSNGTNLAGATNASLTLTDIQTADATGYSVVVTNNYGSATSAVATLTVYLPTTITTQPQNQGVVQGQNVSFSVATSGTGPFTYQWYLGTSALGGPQSATNRINHVGTGSAGSYSVVVTGAGGSVTSAPAVLTVYVPPGIQTQPQNQTVLQGQNATFTVVTNNNGTAPFSYQWNVNGTNTTDGLSIYGSTNATLTLSNVQPAQAGNLFAVITNFAGSITSSVATLTVNVPATITNQPLPQTVLAGQTAAFSVGAIGTPNLSYQWYFNCAQLNGAQSQNATLTLSAVDTNNAGNYTVVVSNNYGSATSAVVTLTVWTPPTIAIQPTNQAMVLGQNAKFAVVAWGTPTLAYQWNMNGTNLAGATNTALTLTNIQTATAASYSVVVNNNFGSATSAVATLTVYSPTTITTEPQSQGVPQGQNVSFSVGVSGSGPFTYQWYFGSSVLGGPQTATNSISNVGPGSAGSYSAVVTGAGGSVTSAPAILTVYVPPGIQTQPQNQTVLQGQTATFSVMTNNNGTPPFYYQWNVNNTNIVDGPDIFGTTNATLTLSNVQPAQAGSVFVVITNKGGSLTSSLATLTVNVPATITNQPGSQTVLAGQTATFSVGATGTPDLSYQWYFKGVKMGSGSTSATLSLNAVATNNTGHYKVVVNNGYGTVTSSVVTLTVCVPPSIATQPTNEALVLGQNATFAVVASGTPTLAYQWNMNGTNLAGATNASLTLNNIQTMDAANYSVSVTNSWGSTTSEVATLSILLPPSITNQPQSQTLAMGQTATFRAGAAGSAPLFYQWFFNGAALPGATNPVCVLLGAHATNAGSYVLVVTNLAGSLTSTSAMLTVTNPVITFSTATSSSPVLTASGFSFQVSVPAEVSYIILTSTDLINWTPMVTNVAVTGNEVVTDTSASNLPARFYQVLVQ
jgi:hypothetical protein